MKTIFILTSIAFALCTSVNAKGISGKTTFDGRFNTECPVWGRDGKKELCEVSFFKLIAVPERYDKKMISLTGFIIKSFGRIVLFPNKMRYDANLQIEGVELVGKLDISRHLMRKIDKGFFPVMVTGTFDATYLGADVHKLGAITNVISIRPILHIPEK